ncbi:DNA sulfur modification protein DndB [Oscillatoria salina]|uniref:DNA sulfur modification protein DndB n=1 Tax=Oscillatoria salina TaxID=331517 RepID=UPI001CCFE261|nr:DNA sulfur modification protein DndB [Oscillatoria salina]MBZ8179285.1 DGQHR domain-containing protein [Oscillatoria salina IIICB1]
MSENNDLYFETNQRLDSIIEPYFAKYHRQKCYPGLIFQQGKRKMVQINLPADDLPTLLQAKPSTGNDPDSGKNRPEVKGHVDEVKQYLLERTKRSKPWILGTLTANVNPEEIELIELGRGFCLVVIPRGVKLDITDGQHRKRAIHELIESQEGELIADNDFPITLVLESDFNQCQTDFRDMAQTKPLDKALLLSFGEFEGRVGITKNLIERVPMFNGKTEKIKNSPSTKKKLIYTTNYIARTVSCAFTNVPSNELQHHDVDKLSDAMVACLNQFFSECSSTKHIFETNVEDLTVDEIAKFKEHCILGRSVGLEILGRLLYQTYNQYNYYFEADKVSQLAQLDWSRGSQLWQGNVIISSPNPKNPAKPYKVLSHTSAVRVAIERVKVSLDWM